MKLTKKEAVELSIKKWEWIVENDGILVSILLYEKIPKLSVLISGCGLCEKYIKTDDNHHYSCYKCPIISNDYNPKEENLGCRTKGHVWNKWTHKQTKKNAQKVLDLIKSIKV